jgi:phosphatidate cytidylyltransferase
LAAWEWARLNAASPYISIALAVVWAAACAVFWLQANAVASLAGLCSWAAVVVWVLGGAWALQRGPQAWPVLARGLRWALGFGMLWVAWLAFVQAKALGMNFVLSVFCMVWVADTAAYAGGRVWGRRKLAPTISPGKTWEGVISAVVAVQGLALLWAQVFDQRLPIDSPSVYALLHRHWGVWGASLAVAALTGVGVLGDLLESLVKRSAGAKDSSSLLPGHGGVLDRVDSLLPVFPLALLWVT